MAQGQVIELAENTLPFWSRFTLTANLRFNGTDVFRTLFEPGYQIPVYDYRRGEGDVIALEGSRSTERDTILQKANETRGGEKYIIKGVSITKDGYPYERGNVTGSDDGTQHTLIPPMSIAPANGGLVAVGGIVPTVEDFRALDSMMWEILQKYFFWELQIDGTRRILQMGPTALYPGVGGPAGGNVDTTNGGTFIQNYMKIEETIQWNPSGSKDSNLVALLKAAYRCRVPTWTAPDGLDDDEDPIPNAVPTALGREWTQGWIMNFHGQAISPISSIS